MRQPFLNIYAAPAAEASQQLDYTTFTENDPTHQITQTTDCIAYNNVETRNTDAYVYKAYSISGDFSFTLDTMMTASNTFSGETLLWGVTNDPADTFEDWPNGGLVLAVYHNGNPFLKLGTIGSYDTSVTLSKNVRYYVRVSRMSTNLKADIYSDAGMTALVDSLSKNLTSGASYQYLYGFSTRTVSSRTKKATGDVCHLVNENASGPSVPGAPALNVPVAGDGVVNLSWNAVPGATGYKVKRGTTSGNYTVTTDVGHVTSDQVTGLSNGTTYYFVVSAYNGAGEGANSNEQSGTPQVAAPSAPTLNTPTVGDRVVNLSWNAIATATSYQVKYGTSSGSYGTIQAVGNVTSHQVTGLTNGTTYYFVVSASNAGGESPHSNEQAARPQAPVTPITFIQNVDYNAAGQITKIQFGNGNVTEYTYHPLNLRLTNIKTATAQLQVIQDLSYSYDAVGNILSITDNINTADQTFQYDALNRLTSANAPGSYGSKTYAYDTIGNILQKDGVTYLYGENGHGPHAVTSGSDGSTFSYDANGNMTAMNKGGVAWAYIYDTENRLTEVKKNAQTQVQYEYDGDGGRTKKISYTWLGGNPTTETTRYVGSLYEVSETQATNHVFMGDTRIASITNGQLKYYHGDHLGGTNLVTDSNGAVKHLVEYDPYGQTSRNNLFGTAEEEAWHLFTSKEFDEEAGLYYYGARYYDPTVGRFITADDFIPSPGSSQGFNRYSYAYNNPVVFLDANGHFPWLAFAIGATIGGASAGIQSYQQTGEVDFGSIAIGAIIGGLSGATLSPATTASSLQIIAFPKTSMFLLKSSAALTLGSQVSGAVGLSDVSRVMGFGAQYLGYAFFGLHVGVGIANWIHDPRYQTVRLSGNGTAIKSGDKVHMNGILTPLEEAKGFTNSALAEAKIAGADVLAYNPTSSPIADLMESLLEKITFTGSMERQLMGNLNGLTNIALSGFSQGGIIAANISLVLGLMDQRNVVSQLTVRSSQISQLRVGISGAIGGGLSFGDKSIIYQVGSPLDFSNALGPNINPQYFLGGVAGLALLPIGIANHTWPQN